MIIFLLFYSFLQANDIKAQQEPQKLNNKTRLELASYVKNQDTVALTKWLNKNVRGVSERLGNVLYEKVIESNNREMFAIINRFIKYDDKLFFESLDSLPPSADYQGYAKIILKHSPHCITHVIAIAANKNDYDLYTSLLKEYKSLITEEAVLSLFFFNIKRQKKAYTQALILSEPVHTTNLRNEIFILASYFGAQSIAQDFLLKYNIDSNAICTTYYNLKDETFFGKLTRLFEYRVNTISKSAPSIGMAPVFNNIRASKFLKMHNSLLLHYGQLYRIKYQLTTLPFVPPYIVVFDEDEMASTINLHEIYFSEPTKSISSKLVYQSRNIDRMAYILAHQRSYTIFTYYDSMPLTIFLELEPVDNIPQSQIPDIWALNPLATDFTLIHRDERFQAYLSKERPPESSELDPDGFPLQDGNSDSESDPPSPSAEGHATV